MNSFGPKKGAIQVLRHYPAMFFDRATLSVHPAVTLPILPAFALGPHGCFGIPESLAPLPVQMAVPEAEVQPLTSVDRACSALLPRARTQWVTGCFPALIVLVAEPMRIVGCAA